MVAISIFLVIFIVITVYLCRTKLIKRKRKDDDTYLLKDATNTLSVFVLYHHGCELLHKFLRNFTLILHSHGVEVKIAMSEQTTIDAEGGVMLFTEKNILTADYTLVILTQNCQADYIHKDYEYGIHLIRQNVANDQQQCAKYIPVYLDGNRNEQLLPPSIAGCADYNLPTDIEDLLKLFIAEVILTDQDRLRIANMEKLSKDVALDGHQRCINRYCDKGRIEPSVSKLSSSCMSVVTRGDFDERRRLPSITESINGQMQNLDHFIQSLPNYDTRRNMSKSMPHIPEYSRT